MVESKTRELERSLEQERIMVKQLEAERRTLEEELCGVRQFLKDKEPMMRQMQGWLQEKRY